MADEFFRGEENLTLADSDSAAGQSTTVEVGADGAVLLPQGINFGNADFAQSGSDLVITAPDGTEVVVEGYFDQETAPTLKTPGGSELPGDTATHLARVLSPSLEVAQSAPTADAQPIGQVESVTGTVVAIRANGDRVELEAGDPVFQGDVLQSGEAGAIGIVLADETTFSMAENGRVVLDEMVYDPGTQEGSISMSVLQGVFTFVSGQVAKVDPDAMTLKTPVATNGIRGTQVGIDLRPTEDGEPDLRVVLMEESDGFVGEVVISNATGIQILNLPDQGSTVTGINSAPAEPRVFQRSEIRESFGDALDSLPTAVGTGNDYAPREDEPQEQEEQQENEEAAAGEEGEEEAATEEVAEEGVEEFAEAEGEGGEAGSEESEGEDLEDFETAAGGAEEEGAEEGEAAVEAGTDGEVDQDLEDFETAAGGEEEVAVADEAPDDGAGDFIEVAGDEDLGLNIGGGGVTGVVATEETDDGDDGRRADEDIRDNVIIGVPDPEPEPPIVSLQAAVGDEDTAIELTISASVPAGSPGAIQSVTISNIPEGATISLDGVELVLTDAGDGTFSVQLAPGQLTGLTIQPGLDENADFELEVSAANFDPVTGSTATGSGTLDVTVNATVDPAVVTAAPGTGIGDEDTAIPVDISTELADADGTVTSLSITDIPEGAVLMSGDTVVTLTGPDADGLYSAVLSPDQLTGLTITPDQDDAHDFSLNITATSTDIDPDMVDSAAAVAAVNEAAAVEAKADAEDAADALVDAQTALTDARTAAAATAETDAIAASDAADTALGHAQTNFDEAESALNDVLNAPGGSGGTEAEIADLRAIFEAAETALTAAGEAATDAATAETDAIAASDTADAAVEANAAVTTATSDAADAQTAEDQATAVSDAADAVVADAQTALDDATTALADANAAVGPDAPTEAEIADLETAVADAETALATATETAAAADTAEADAIAASDAADSVEAEATATYEALNTGHVTNTSETFAQTIEVIATVDAPVVATEDASGDEDTTIALDISATVDTIDIPDGTLESITIGDIPEGATLTYVDDTGATVELTVTGGSVTLSPDQLTGLQITPLSDDAHDFDLTVTATAVDIDPDFQIAVDNAEAAAADAETAETGAVAASDAADLVVSEAETALAAAETALGDAVDPTEAELAELNAELIGAGDVLTAATDAAAEAESAEADAITASDAADLEVAEAQATADAADATLSDAEAALAGGGISNTSEPVNLNVEMIATVDAPELSAENASGDEDTAIALDITATVDTIDIPDGTLQSITIGGFPPGATLSYVDDTGATIELTVADGSVILSPEQLNGLAVTPAEDDANDFDLTVTATATDTDPDTGNLVTNTSEPVDLNVEVIATVDAPEVSAQDAIGDEDTAIALDITATVDEIGIPDGTLQSITIGDIPTGATLSYVDDTGATVELTITDGSVTLSPEQLNGLAVTPVEDDANDFDLSVTATDPDTGNQVSNTSAPVALAVVVLATAEVDVSTQDASGEENTAIPLDITASVDVGDDTLESVTIGDIPPGATLTYVDSAGVTQEIIVTDGGATLTAEQLNGLAITPAESDVTEFSLSVSATSSDTDPDTGEIVTATDGPVPLTVNITGGNVAPEANDDTVFGIEDIAVIIDPETLLANDTDADGDILEITSVANPVGGSVEIIDGNIVFTPDANYSGEASFDYTVTDGGGLTSTATTTVEIEAVADAPIVSVDVTLVSQTFDDDDVEDLDGVVHQYRTKGDDDVADIKHGAESVYDVDIEAALVDTDGSESLSTIEVTGLPSGATLSAGTLNTDGSWTLTAEQLEGLQMTLVATVPDDFNLTVTVTSTEESNQDSATSSSSATIVVNLEPDAFDDFVNLNEDAATIIDPAANDTDADGDTLSVTEITHGPHHGTVTINEDGTVTYTPDADYNGTDHFTYVISDGAGGFDTARVNLTVDPVNDDPVAVDDTAIIDEDSSVNLNVMQNDYDVDGVSVSMDSVTQPEHGTVTINGNGTVTYTPDANFNGADSFTYTIIDAEGATSTATVNLTVNPDDDSPVAVADVATLDEDSSAIIDALANDMAADGGLALDSFTQPEHGLVTVNEDGTFTYTPDANYNGGDSLTYTITDSDGDLSTAIVSIAVNPVDDPVVAVEDSAVLNEDASAVIDVLANDTAVDGGLELTGVTQPLHGTVAINDDGTVTYTPAENYNGTDSFTYSITDADGDVSTATVSLTINPENDNPVAVDDDVSLNEDASAVIDVLANDTDLDGDNLTVTEVTQPANGTVVINADGTVTYTPDANYYGDDSFTYTISDGQGGTDTATVSLTVNPENDAPVAADDTAIINEDTAAVIDVLANDTDLDGDTLSLDSVTQPEHGLVTINADGTVTYTPDADYTGSDSFTYTISDGAGDTDTATVSLTVNPENDAPVATDDAVTLNEDAAAVIDVLANDTDLDGGPLSVDSITQPEHGLVAINEDGTVTYTPDADFNGTDSFTYTVSDGAGGFDTATVSLTVDPANDAPVAVDDTVSGTEDTPLVINPETLLANDTDVDGDTLEITAVDSPVGGSVEIIDGNVVFTPDANYSGPASFDYTVTDASGATSTATTPVNIEAVADAPTLSVGITEVEGSGEADLFPVMEADISNVVMYVDVGGEIIKVKVEAFNGPDASFRDADELPLEEYVAENYPEGSLVAVTVKAGENQLEEAGPGEGQLFILDGSVSQNDLPLDENVPAELTFSYDQALEDVEHSAGGDTVYDVNIQTGLTDTDGSESLSVTVTDVPDGASFTDGTLNSDGSWNFTAEQLDGLQMTVDDTVGDDFSLTVTSTSTEASNLDSASTTLTTSVGVNAGPAASDDSAVLNEDASAVIDVLANDSDLDGDDIYVGSVTEPAHGTVTINEDGTVTYTPDANYAGADSFTYTIYDGEGNADTATVSLNVTADADAPVVVAENVSGAEDGGWIGLDLSANLADSDGSETLSITISNVPEGAQLSAGTDLGGGNWAIAPEELSLLSINPDADFSGDINLGVSVTSTETGGDSATVDSEFTVTVTPTGDVTVSVDDVTGAEDALEIGLGLSTESFSIDDADGSEVLQSIEISIPDLPEGAVVNNATFNQETGTYTVATAAALAIVSVTPPADWSGEFNVTLNVTSNEGSASQSFSVSVSSGNDAPVISASPVFSMAEDGVITISEEQLLAGASDVDGDALVITDLVVNGGTGTLAGPDADGNFTYTPPENFNGEVSLNYNVSDGTASVPQTADITVVPVNDDPVAVADTDFVAEADVSVTGNVVGNDSDVDGDVLSVTQVDFGGTTHTFAEGETTMIIEGDNGTLTIATDGSYTYVKADGDGGTPAETVSVGGSDADAQDWADAGVTISAFDFGTSYTDENGNFDAANADDNAQFSSTGIGVEGTQGAGQASSQIEYDSQSGDSEALALTFDTSVSSADVTVSRLFHGEGNDGEQGQWQAFDSDGNLVGTGDINDTTVTYDGSSNVGTMSIDLGGTAFSTIVFTATEMSGSGSDFKIQAVEFEDVATDGFVASGEDVFTYTVADGAGGTDTAALTITVEADNSAPTVSTAPAFAMNEDGTIIISEAQLLEGASDVDGDGLSVIDLGVNDGEGTLTGPDTDGNYTYQPAADFSGSVSLNYNVTDGAASVPQTASIAVAGVADTPELSAGVTGATEVLAETDVPVSQALLDQVDADHVVTITGVPEGATLNAGVDNGDGSWTLTGDVLEGLQVTPPDGYEGDFNLDVSVADPGETQTLLEADFNTDTGGFTYSDDVFGTDHKKRASENLDDDDGIDDSGALLVKLGGGTNDDDDSGTDAMSGGFEQSFTVTDEGTATLTFSYRMDMDNRYDDGEYSEILVSIDGELVSLDGNDYIVHIEGGGDTGWQTVTLDLGSLPEGEHSLVLGGYNNLSTSKSEKTEIYFDDLALTLETNPEEVASESVAFAPDVSAHVYGVDVAAALTDGSETLSAITFDGLPDGVTLNAGEPDGTGGWTVDAVDLAGLEVTVPDGSPAFEMTVSATSTEENGDTATITQALDFSDHMGADTADTLAGEAGDSADTLYGGSGADDITGGDGNDSIFGGDGMDSLYGGSGVDFLSGGEGDDIIYGESGNDIILGGAGDDQLHGGDGDDEFVFNLGDGNDTIFDFEAGDQLTFDGVSLADGDTVEITTDGNDVVITIIGKDGTETNKVTLKDSAEETESSSGAEHVGDGYSVTDTGDGGVSIVVDQVT